MFADQLGICVSFHWTWFSTPIFHSFSMFNVSLRQITQILYFLLKTRRRRSFLRRRLMKNHQRFSFIIWCWRKNKKWLCLKNGLVALVFFYFNMKIMIYINMGDEKSINHNRPDTGPTFLMYYVAIGKGKRKKSQKKIQWNLLLANYVV